MNLELPRNTSDLKEFFIPLIDNFVESNTSLICEIPRISANEGILHLGDTFSPYFNPKVVQKISGPLATDQSIELLQSDLRSIVEEGYNHVRSEASEIIAFVATNSSRIATVGIPAHLPIAYGLRGNSMSISVMRNMLQDIYIDLD